MGPFYNFFTTFEAEDMRIYARICQESAKSVQKADAEKPSKIKEKRGYTKLCKEK